MAHFLPQGQGHYHLLSAADLEELKKLGRRFSSTGHLPNSPPVYSNLTRPTLPTAGSTSYASSSSHILQPPITPTLIPALDLQANPLTATPTTDFLTQSDDSPNKMKEVYAKLIQQYHLHEKLMGEISCLKNIQQPSAHKFSNPLLDPAFNPTVLSFQAAQKAQLNARISEASSKIKEGLTTFLKEIQKIEKTQTQTQIQAPIILVDALMHKLMLYKAAIHKHSLEKPQNNAELTQLKELFQKDAEDLAQKLELLGDSNTIKTTLAQENLDDFFEKIETSYKEMTGQDLNFLNTALNTAPNTNLDGDLGDLDDLNLDDIVNYLNGSPTSVNASNTPPDFAPTFSNTVNDAPVMPIHTGFTDPTQLPVAPLNRPLAAGATEATWAPTLPTLPTGSELPHPNDLNLGLGLGFDLDQEFQLPSPISSEDELPSAFSFSDIDTNDSALQTPTNTSADAPSTSSRKRRARLEDVQPLAKKPKTSKKQMMREENSLKMMPIIQEYLKNPNVTLQPLIDKIRQEQGLSISNSIVWRRLNLIFKIYFENYDSDENFQIAIQQKIGALGEHRISLELMKEAINQISESALSLYSKADFLKGKYNYPAGIKSNLPLFIQHLLKIGKLEEADANKCLKLLEEQGLGSKNLVLDPEIRKQANQILLKERASNTPYKKLAETDFSKEQSVDHHKWANLFRNLMRAQIKKMNDEGLSKANIYQALAEEYEIDAALIEKSMETYKPWEEL